MSNSKYLEKKKQSWERLEAIFGLPSTSTRGRKFHNYARSALRDSAGRNFLSTLGCLFDEIEASEMIARLNSEVLLRNRAGLSSNFTRAGLCARDADLAWEKYVKNNRKWEMVKQPSMKEMQGFELRWGESGILEDGEPDTAVPPSFGDENNGQQGAIKSGSPSGASDEVSDAEDVDMDILEEKHMEEIDRIVAHSKIVCAILGKCSDVLTFVVGPGKEKLVCHKMLICFYTESVDEYCREKLDSAEQKSVKIASECPTQIRTFIAWLYSGLIDSTAPSDLEHLWVLGDRFSSPAFANEVMFHLFDQYGSGTRWITAATAGYVYGATDAESKLRLFVKALIASHGPLSARALASNTKHFQEEWHSIIRMGGEIVLDIAVHSSFSNDDPSQSPCKPENQAPFLLSFDDTVEDFLSVQDRLSGEKVGANTNDEVAMQ